MSLDPDTALSNSCRPRRVGGDPPRAAFARGRVAPCAVREPFRKRRCPDMSSRDAGLLLRFSIAPPRESTQASPWFCGWKVRIRRVVDNSRVRRAARR